jgi:hypothetical protein
MRRRILALTGRPDKSAPENDWVNGRVRLLGESYGRARRKIDKLLRSGRLTVLYDDERDEGRP